MSEVGYLSASDPKSKMWRTGLRSASSSAMRLTWEGLYWNSCIKSAICERPTSNNATVLHQLLQRRSTASLKRSCQTHAVGSEKETGDQYAEHASSTSDPEVTIERAPLPPGLSRDVFGLYEVLDSEKDMREVEGKNAVVAIHGPTETWLPKGIEAHGAHGGMWAVIGTSGTQYKVMKGDVLYTNRYAGEVNTQISFDWVLAIGAFDWTLFGRPLIKQAKVLATIEEQTRSGKVMVIRFKKRKGYRRKQGHRQPITRFRIDDIVYEWPEADKIKVYDIPYCADRPPLPNHVRFL